MAITRAARSRARCAFNAAAMLMLTWSSRFAEVGMVSDAGGMRECLELGHQRRGGHLSEHVARMQAALAGEERRKAAQRRIDQPVRRRSQIVASCARARTMTRWPVPRAPHGSSRRTRCRPLARINM